MVCSSNTCERLFSSAKLNLSDLRKSMAPSTLNMVLILKANRRLWPIPNIIQEILDELSTDMCDDDDYSNSDEEEEEIPEDNKE